MKMVSLVEINSSQLSSLAIVDGQLICCLDTSDFYRDIKNYRIKLSSDIIFVDSLPLAPLYNRIYFLTTDCVLYTYLNDDWVAINMNTDTLISELNKKVDKVSGKGLSTNDFTNELKTKLDGIATGANKYTLPAATSSALGGVKIGSNITNSSGTISITKANVTAALGYTPPTQDTNTHYASKNVVGSNTATSNTTSALTNGNVYLNSIENGTVTSSHKISGSGATSVTTDTSGNIIISSTNTTYSTMKGATSSANGSAGLVPAPASGKQASFLRGDGTWAIPADTKVSQKIGTTNADRRVLLSWSANDTEESSYVVKSANFIANPVTGQFYAKGYKRNDITGSTLDIDTLTLSDGYPEIMRYIEKTSGGAANITNIPVANQPFILDVELIRWANNTNYITKQTFTPISSTLNDDEYVRFCNSGTWTAWKKRLFTDNNTTYSVATTSANGLMSSSDKSKLDGIAAGANKYTLPTASSSTLGGVKTGSNITNSSGTISITKANVTAALGYTPPTQDTNTHYTSKNVVGATDSTSNTTSALTNGNVYLNSVENNAITSSHKISGNGATSVTTDASGNIIVSSTNTTYSNATTSTAGLMSSSDKTKLDGIATGANKTVVDSSLSSSSTNPVQNKVIYTALSGKLNTSLKGSNNGLAELDENGKVPSSQLPSYVDDVIEGYLNSGKFYIDSEYTTEITGETGKIYINLSNSKTYRWSGSAFVVISETIALGETSSTAYRGDKGKVAYNHSQLTSGNPHKVTKSDVGLGNVENKSSATIRGELTKDNVTAALGYTPPAQDTNTHYASKNVVGGNTATSNTTSALTNGNVYLNSVENGVVTSSHKISGSGATGVTTDTNGNIIISSTNTTYSVATTSANGLMSSSDKSKLDGIAANANNYSLPAATSSVLGGVKTGSNITNSSGTISITKANVTAALGYTPPTQDTNTHYESKNVVGSNTAISNTTSALSNGNVYLNSVENGAVTSSHKISGSGATSVTTDTSGNIVISSTNTTYNVATTNANGLMSSSDKTKLDGIETGANKYTLPTATNSVLGGVKIGSNITNNSGTISITKANVTSALGYTPPTTDTTYSNATTSTAGLMSSSDKTKLDGIAAGANKYTLPTATSSVLGGVKVGSNITNSSGTISITKANVVAALGYTPPTTDTNTHYESKNVVGATDATSNTTTALTNGNVYLNSVENGAVTSSHKISGSGATTVKTDTSGNIIISSTNTTYSTMTGATSSANGTSGLVPAPASGKQASFLRGDGTWATPVDTKVTQKNATADSAKRVILSANANDTEETNYVVKSANFTANPTTGEFYAKGYKRNDITGSKLDINTLTLSSGHPEIMRYIEKTSDGAANITNTPVVNQPFILDVELIRWESTSDYVTKQTFVPVYASDDEYVRYCGGGTWTAWKKRLFTDNNTTYSVATTSANGLMSSSDKSKLDGIATGANNYTLPAATSSALGGVKVGSNITNSSGTISITKANVVAALGYTPPTQNTDTHYASKNVVGSNTATSNTTSALTNGNVYLNSVENGAVTSSHKISGSGATGVTTDTNGNIIISSTNTTYSNATTSAAGLMSSSDKTKLDGIAANANNYTLPAASNSTLGGVKIGSNITNSSGTISITKTNVVAALGYTPPEPDLATTSTNGLMSSDDKTKLDGIAANANNYTLPAATSSALGGVKVGSNITNSSGTISITKANVTAALGYTPPTTNTTYSVATTSANGLMSSSDKSKLDGIATGANKTVVDSTLSDTSTNPVQNKVINTALNSKSPKEGSTELVQLAANVIIGNGEGVASILHDQGEVYEKIEIIDNNTSGNAVFKFSQSTNSGESFDRLMQINDDGNIIANKFNGYTIASNVPANAKFTDTTYSTATTSANGLMSSSDKTKLNGIATGANNYTLPAATSSALGGVKVGSNITNSSGTISITKANVTAALGYTPPAQDTNTHYASKNVVGSNTATSNTTSALTNGNVYLNSVENGAVTSSHKISGSGATSVTTDANGNIIISSTNTTYSTATTSTNGLMSSSDKSKLDGIATGANKTVVDSALSDTSTNPVQNKVVYSALSGKSDTDHTHNYAGSSSAGGSADSAVKLQTARTINGVSFDGTSNITITANPTQTQLTNQDLNTVKTYGEYYAAGSNTCTNKPNGVDPFNLKVIRSATGYIIQELTQATSGEYKKYTRQYNNSSWSEWKYYIDSTNISDVAFRNFIGSDVGKTYSNGSTHTAQEMMLGTDYNDIIESGTYVIRGSSSYPTSNAPDGNNTSNVFYVIVIKYISSYIKQIAFSARTFDTIYQRNMSGGKWTAWSKFSDDSKLVPYLGYNDDDILGLEVDYENNTYTRLAGAVGLSAGANFDKFNMYGGRKRCIIHASGILGYYGDESYSNLIGSVQSSGYNIMVYQPRFYYRVVPLKLERNTDGIGYYMKKGRYYISDNPKPGFKLHPAFYDEDGNELEGIYYSAYENSIRQVSNDGNTTTYTSYLNNEITSYDRKYELESIPEAIPCHGISITNLEKFATPVNNYAGISSCHLETIKTLSANQLLMMIEYGSLNLQNTLNKGISTLTSATSPVVTGGTESLGNASGMASGTEGEVSFSYRGMENIYGNIFKSVQGILLFGNGNKKGGQPYIAKGFNYDYSTDPLINYDPVNFYIPSSGGYIKYFGYDENFDWLFLPVDVSGSSTAPVGDYIFDKEINDTFPYKISYGGRYKNKTQVGPFTYSTNIAYNSVNASSETGGRVVYYPKYKGSIFA